MPEDRPDTCFPNKTLRSNRLGIFPHSTGLVKPTALTTFRLPVFPPRRGWSPAILAGFFLICWTGLLIRSVRGTDNLGFVMLRGRGEDAGLRASLDVGKYAPQGMSHSLYLYKDGIWRIPVSPKRPVQSIVLSHANGDKPKNMFWEISVSSTSTPHWMPAAVSWVPPHLVLTLDPAMTPGSLWPARKSVFNWLGDGRILGSDTRQALEVTLLSWLGLLWITWLWRAAGE